MPNYYNVSVHTSTEEAGDSVATQTLPNSTILNITPHMGYVVDASNFYIGDPLPPEIDSVSFSDSTTPGTSGNIVYATVTLNPQFSMPSSNYTIEIDIDGVALPTSTMGPFDITLVSNVPDGYCTPVMWPMNQSANRNNPLQRCEGNFWESEEFSPPVTSHIASSSAGFIREVWKVDNAPINTLLPIFRKVAFSSVGYYFPTPPSYTIQGYVNNYTVEESPNNLEVTTVVTSDVGNSNIIHLDATTGIIPGMIISAVSGNVFSVANANPGEWPHAGLDVRVLSVNHIARTVEVSEAQPYIFNGNTLSFSTQDQNGNVLTKEFVFSFTADSNVQELDSIIHFAAVPVQIPTQSLQGNTSGTSTVPVITQVTI